MHPERLVSSDIVLILKFLKQDQKPHVFKKKQHTPLDLLFLMIMEAVPQMLRQIWHRNSLRVPRPSHFLTQILSMKTSRHSRMGNVDVRGPCSNPWPSEKRKWWRDASLFLPPGWQFWRKVLQERWEHPVSQRGGQLCYSFLYWHSLFLYFTFPFPHFCSLGSHGHTYYLHISFTLASVEMTTYLGTLESC